MVRTLKALSHSLFRSTSAGDAGPLFELVRQPAGPPTFPPPGPPLEDDPLRFYVPDGTHV
jgi:hypothetical protein